MTREVSQGTEKAYFKGQVLTVEELKKRFSLAVTINNEDIIKILLNAEQPLITKDIAEALKLEERKSEPISRSLRKLFKDGLMVRFDLGAHRLSYLLSEKGFKNYQEAQKVPKTLRKT
jgi:predicted transcriptional regulator